MDAEQLDVKGGSPGTKKEKDKDSKYDASLLFAMHSVFWKRWWFAGFLYFLAMILTTTTPLLTKVSLILIQSFYPKW